MSVSVLDDNPRFGGLGSELRLSSMMRKHCRAPNGSLRALNCCCICTWRWPSGGCFVRLYRWGHVIDSRVTSEFRSLYHHEGTRARLAVQSLLQEMQKWKDNWSCYLESILQIRTSLSCLSESVVWFVPVTRNQSSAGGWEMKMGGRSAKAPRLDMYEDMPMHALPHLCEAGNAQSRFPLLHSSPTSQHTDPRPREQVHKTENYEWPTWKQTCPPWSWLFCIQSAKPRSLTFWTLSMCFSIVVLIFC